VRSPDSLRRTPLRINSREQRAALEDPLLCCPVGKRRASEEQSQPALRLGMRLVRGLGEAEAARIDEAVRRAGPFATLRDLWRSSGVRVASLRRLAAADAFRSMGLDRQQALWQVRALRDAPAPLFEQASSTARSIKVDERSAHAPDHHESPPSPAPALSRLPPVPPLAAVAHDYTAVGLSLKRHPLACLRDRLRTLHDTLHDTPQGTRPVAPHITTPVSPCASLRDACLTPQGTLLAVAGVVLVRQRPSTAKGILFMTIEDESGIANLIIRPKVYERFRRAARMSVILLVTGRVERKGDVVHILARRLRNISGLATHTLGEEDIPITVRKYR
jgi:error-prone DNA polymerase